MAEADKLEGLAQWLRADALDAKSHGTRNKLIRWADAVEALAASPQPAQGADTTEAKLPELPKAILDFDQFLNEPPSYEEKRMVREYRHDAYPRWAKALDAMREYALAAIALNAATEEDRAAILEATQAIRDHGRDLIENEWSSTGESLMAKARKIERIVLKGTHEPR
jgi:tetratricopeptide (TPR) repeat protein